jgi:hypothetical protein
MEFILVLIFLVLSLIYLKLAIKYHPKFLDFFKRQDIKAAGLHINNRDSITVKMHFGEKSSSETLVLNDH